MATKQEVFQYIRDQATDADLKKVKQLWKLRKRALVSQSKLGNLQKLLKKPDFETKTGVSATIWDDPLALQRNLHATQPDQKWEPTFKKLVLNKFSRDEPVVELTKDNKTSFYSVRDALDVLDWLY
jgi:hypothetical protein